MARKAAALNVVEVPSGTVLWHGTDDSTRFVTPDGPAWFTDRVEIAAMFALNKGELPDVVKYFTKRPLRLVELRDSVEDYSRLMSRRKPKAGSDLDRFVRALGFRARFDWDYQQLAASACKLGIDGWLRPRSLRHDADDVVLCNPAEVVRRERAYAVIWDDNSGTISFEAGASRSRKTG